MGQLIDQSTIDEFTQKGVTVLKGVFNDWVDVLRRALMPIWKIQIRMPAYIKGMKEMGGFLLITAIGTGFPNIGILSSILLLRQLRQIL